MRARNALNRRCASRTSGTHSMYGRAGLVVLLYSSLNAAKHHEGFRAFWVDSEHRSILHHKDLPAFLTVHTNAVAAEVHKCCTLEGKLA